MNHSWCKNIKVVPSLDHLWLIRSDGQHLVLLGMNALDLCFPLGYQFIWVVFIINVNNASMNCIYVGKLHSHLRDKRNIPFMHYSWAGGGDELLFMYKLTLMLLRDYTFADFEVDECHTQTWTNAFMSDVKNVKKKHYLM